MAPPLGGAFLNVPLLPPQGSSPSSSSPAVSRRLRTPRPICTTTGCPSWYDHRWGPWASRCLVSPVSPCGSPVHLTRLSHLFLSLVCPCRRWSWAPTSSPTGSSACTRCVWTPSSSASVSGSRLSAQLQDTGESVCIEAFKRRM